MGVQKAVEFNNTGITLNYWRINSVTVDIEENYTNCRVGGYVSKADALAGKKAVMNLNYSFRGAHNPIQLETDPTTYSTLLYNEVITTGNPFVPNKLAGGEIVSDLP